MPATRRKSHGPASRGGQSTLAFARGAKVTKPSTAAMTKAKHLESSSLLELDPAQKQASTKSEISAEEQIAKEKENETGPSPEDVSARKIGHTQLRSYWRAREAERKAPRVHQQGLSTNEKILRHFDLSSQYGPCVGIARRKRWNRAQSLGLRPPIEVLAVLLHEESTGKPTEQAYVDELLSTRFVIE
ncbi:MAG: hypothetical protein M1838_000817 [Thelocarpon superellum]|nr:MAG: hypothetical protein M1838_000817 [Thelocarpon superellum]